MQAAVLRAGMEGRVISPPLPFYWVINNSPGLRCSPHPVSCLPHLPPLSPSTALPVIRCQSGLGAVGSKSLWETHVSPPGDQLWTRPACPASGGFRRPGGVTGPRGRLPPSLPLQVCGCSCTVAFGGTLADLGRNVEGVALPSG